MVPKPKLMKMFIGMISRPARTRITVMPLKKTARVAVAPAVAIDSSTLTPLVRSSRKRDTMNSE
jgi:hypothetical protein